MDDVLWVSFANVARAGEEATALIEALTTMLSEEGLGSFVIDPESEEWDNWEAFDEWAVTYYLKEWRVKPRRGRSIAGMLNIALSFWRPEDTHGEGWSGARSAKLYVAFSPRRPSAWDVDTLILNGSGSSHHARSAGSHLWRSTSDGRVPGGWFFCVRLLELQSRDDLRREVLVPLAKLLEDSEDADAFSDSRSVITTV